MSKLQELKIKIESIPEKRSRKNLVGKLAQYDQMSTQAKGVLTKCIRELHYVQSVFPSGDFQRVAEQTARAANVARRLRRRLENISVIETKTSNDQFISISEYAKSAQTALKDRWTQLLTRRIADFENLAKAASSANLEGSRGMVEKLNRLDDRVGAPPISEEITQRIVADLHDLEKSVSTLGLEGRPGEFLVAAANEQGNPQDLLDSEVAAFIEKYNLWGLLTVKLG